MQYTEPCKNHHARIIVFECDLYYLSIGLSIYLFPWLTWLNHTMEIFGTTKKIMLWKITLWKFMLAKGLLYTYSINVCTPYEIDTLLEFNDSDIYKPNFLWKPIIHANGRPIDKWAVNESWSGHKLRDMTPYFNCQVCPPSISSCELPISLIFLHDSRATLI